MKKTLNIEEQNVCNKKKKFWTIGWVPSKESFATIKQWRERLSASTTEK